MAETDDAGWYLCYRDDGRPRAWHYFDRAWLRSRCGRASSFERSIGEVKHWPEISIVARMSPSPFCRGCDKTRRVEEGR